MKLSFLLVLCLALFCALSEGYRNPGHRRRKARPAAPMTSGRPHRFMKRLFKTHKKNFRGAGMMGGSMHGFSTWNPFRKMKMCKMHCQDECMDFHTCRQNCSASCEEARVPVICKLNCVVNDCNSTICTDCHKSCLSGETKCLKQHCLSECARQNRWRKGPQCKRCLAQNCSDEESTEEEEEEEETEPMVNFEDVVQEEIENMQERLSPFFDIFGEDDDVNVVERLSDE